MTVIEMPGKGKDPAGTGSKGNGHGGTDEINAIASALREYKSNTARTWDDIGTEVGYSGAALSMFAASKYPGTNSNAIGEAVEKFLTTIEERRGLITETKFVNTTIARGIVAMLAKAVLMTKIVIIAAESGIGKTTTLQHYYAEHPRVVYIKGNPTFHTNAASTWPFQVELAEALNITARAKGIKTVLYQEIRNTLRNSGRLIIIDEAQFLEPVQLDLVRCLHEEAKIPIALSGNDQIYERAAGAFGSPAAFIQFQSRTLRARFSARDIKQSDVTLIAEQFDVEIGRDAEALLLNEAQASGGLRRLTTILLLAQMHRAGNGKVRKEHVLAAIKELGGDR